jgi:hypothetical protein
VCEEVVPDGDRLRALQVRIARHDPAGVALCLRAKSLDHGSNLDCELPGRCSAVEAEVQRDLVVARPARVQRGSGGCDLGQPPFDGGVNVLIGVEEREGAGIELLADAAKATLDRGQLRGGEDAGGSEPARMRDAAGDVKEVQLVVGVEGR